jgi:hypothetical protein
MGLVLGLGSRLDLSLNILSIGPHQQKSKSHPTVVLLMSPNSFLLVKKEDYSFSFSFFFTF